MRYGRANYLRLVFFFEKNHFSNNYMDGKQAAVEK
jgi:hypothetical protein